MLVFCMVVYIYVYILMSVSICVIIQYSGVKPHDHQDLITS